MLKKIISGGQTGVDRAALDTAIALNIPYSGWCPKGRLAELNEVIPDKYLLKETLSSEYSERTKLNIENSDATLVVVPITPIKVTDGTILTLQYVQEKNKPYYILDLSKEIELDAITEWIAEKNIEVLNIAGPRESQSPGIYQKCLSVLNTLLKNMLENVLVS